MKIFELYAWNVLNTDTLSDFMALGWYLQNIHFLFFLFHCIHHQIKTLFAQIMTMPFIVEKWLVNMKYIVDKTSAVFSI